jgi:hypothetical protein
MNLEYGVATKDFQLYSPYQSKPTDVQQVFEKISDRFGKYFKESISEERLIVSPGEKSGLEIEVKELKYFDFKGTHNFNDLKMYLLSKSRFKITGVTDEFFGKELQPRLEIEVFGESPDKISEFYSILKKIYYPFRFFKKT